MPALYQRARPVRFDEVVGQEHVKDVLLAAIRSGRTGHAYLFSGPRGVGKTTTARLLAMAVNCEHEDPARRPCGVCESCRLVQQGSHPDVTELDAASNNSVEDVRDLREKVRLASLRGGMRVWVLDEAHMLSRAAANALLKTLEEPPPGLLFVLATTEPEKLPPTILSRCQHFRFRRLSDDEIERKLARLCDEAGVDARPGALALVARAADGGMRDAESLLERLLLAEGPITAEAAEDALGLPPQERLRELARHLCARDLGQLFGEAAALYRDGFSPRTLAEQLGRTLRDALFDAVHGGDGFGLGLERGVHLSLIRRLDDELERFTRHNDLYALEVALIKAMAAFEPASRPGFVAAADAAPATTEATSGGPAGGTAGASPSGAGAPAAGNAGRDATGAEAAAAGPAGPPGTADTDTVADTPDAPPAFDPHAGARGPKRSAGAPLAARGRARGRKGEGGTGEGAAGGARSPSGAASSESGGPAAAERRAFSWHAVKSRAGAQLKAFLMPAEEIVEGDLVTLRYDAVHKFHYSQLLRRKTELADLVEEVAGPGYTLQVEGPDGGPPKKS